MAGTPLLLSHLIVHRSHTARVTAGRWIVLSRSYVVPYRSATDPMMRTSTHPSPALMSIHVFPVSSRRVSSYLTDQEHQPHQTSRLRIRTKDAIREKIVTTTTHNPHLIPPLFNPLYKPILHRFPTSKLPIPPTNPSHPHLNLLLPISPPFPPH